MVDVRSPSERRWLDYDPYLQWNKPVNPHSTDRYAELTAAQQRVLAIWINYAVRPKGVAFYEPEQAASGLFMKQAFEAVAFPILPGAFTGGLIQAGYLPLTRYWRFKAQPVSPGFGLDHLTPAERTAFNTLVATAAKAAA